MTWDTLLGFHLNGVGEGTRSYTCVRLDPGTLSITMEQLLQSWQLLKGYIFLTYKKGLFTIAASPYCVDCVGCEVTNGGQFVVVHKL